MYIYIYITGYYFINTETILICHIWCIYIRQAIILSTGRLFCGFSNSIGYIMFLGCGWTNLPWECNHLKQWFGKSIVLVYVSIRYATTTCSKLHGNLYRSVFPWLMLSVFFSSKPELNCLTENPFKLTKAEIMHSR